MLSGYTIEDRIKLAAKHTWNLTKIESTRCPSIAQMAKFINNHFKGKYIATVEDWSESKGRKMPNRRIYVSRQTYYGKKLIVKDSKGEIVLSHCTTETYRQNYEVAEWIIRHWND